MKKLMKFLIAIISVTLVLNACRKDENDDYSIPGGNSSAQINATISGRVLDETGSGVQGVSVSAYGIISCTDANGIFLIQGNVDKNRCVLEFNKPGYMKRLHAIIPSSSSVNYVKIVLQDEPIPQSFQSTNGGTVTLDHGGSVIFPSNSFVIDGTSNYYNGLVTIFSKHISPDNSNFSMLIPGGDLSAVNVDGDNVSLYSYGMASVSMIGSGGENLQLAPGTNATITFPIATTQSSSAPQSIPLWFLNETDALWKEEGLATRVGNNYVGNVSHFTWWNCDHPSPNATATGRVVDCEGTPLANVTVAIDGQRMVVTDQDGYYTNLVSSGITLTFQVLLQGVINFPSQIETVVASSGQSITVPDLVVPCFSRIKGRLTDCNNENISGTVGLILNNELKNYQFVTEGNFSLIAEPFTNYKLVATAPSGTFILNVTSVALSGVFEVGEISACNESSASTSFTLNGIGYVNKIINLDIVNTNEAKYYPFGNITFGYSEGISNQGPCNLNFNFSGNSITTVDATLLSDSIFSINLNGVYMYPSHTSSNHFIINITEYGAVGDFIKGTFSGDVETAGGQSTGTIINGKFALLRGQDY